MSDVDEMFGDITGEHERVTADDVADDNPKVLANHLRHLRTAVESGFERLDTRFEMFTEKVLNAIDDVRRDQASMRRDVSALEASIRKDINAIERRVAALETKRRKARKK